MFRLFGKVNFSGSAADNWKFPNPENGNGGIKWKLYKILFLNNYVAIIKKIYSVSNYYYVITKKVQSHLKVAKWKQDLQ